MMLSIPPKYAVSQVVGYMKGKSAIHLARVDGERKRGFTGREPIEGLETASEVVGGNKAFEMMLRFMAKHSASKPSREALTPSLGPRIPFLAP
jgi:hypothetical protein